MITFNFCLHLIKSKLKKTVFFQAQNAIMDLQKESLSCAGDRDARWGGINKKKKKLPRPDTAQYEGN